MSQPLPQLWGSPRQIEWATSIRLNSLAVWRESVGDEDYEELVKVRDASWWIANRGVNPPKWPTPAQQADPPRKLVQQQAKPYTLDEGKTYQPRGRSTAPPAPVPPLRSGVVSAPTREDWDNATRVEPQRYGPVPGVTPSPYKRAKAANNLTEFINHINGANHLAQALTLAISAKLGDPSIKREAEAALKRIEESVAAIKDILNGTPKTLCEVFTEEKLPPGDEHFGDEP